MFHSFPIEVRNPLDKRLAERVNVLAEYFRQNITIWKNDLKKNNNSFFESLFNEIFNKNKEYYKRLNFDLTLARISFTPSSEKSFLFIIFQLLLKYK